MSETVSPWQPVAGPALALTGAEWRTREVTVTARRNVRTGAREDLLTAGAFADPAPHLQLVVTRDTPKGAAAGSLFLAVARRAAAAGLAVSRTGPSAPLTTKFGMAEIAPVTLASGSRERACTMLRLRRPDVGVGLEGWSCGPPGQPAEGKLACALDGLTLAPGAGDASLKALFGEAERHRSEGCDGSEPTVVASGRARRAERR